MLKNDFLLSPTVTARMDCRAFGGIPMAEDNIFKRRMKKPRQKWEPHWLIKLLYTALTAFWSLAKIAIGAAATVVLP